MNGGEKMIPIILLSGLLLIAILFIVSIITVIRSFERGIVCDKCGGLVPEEKIINNTFMCSCGFIGFEK